MSGMNNAYLFLFYFKREYYKQRQTERDLLNQE